MISKEFKRLYINANPSRWKSFNYRNIHCWRYSIIGKHYRYCRFWVLHQELLFSFWLHNDCQAFSRYTALYRIEILIFQGQERLDLEFVPRPLFVAGAGKYEAACRHTEKKKKKGRWKLPQVCSFNSRWWTRENGINFLSRLWVIIRVFKTVYNDNKSFEANRLYDAAKRFFSRTTGTTLSIQLYDAAKRPERLTKLTFRNH